MKELNKLISQCQSCPLSQSKGQTVSGEGKCRKNVIILAEAPGEQEEKTGQPFQGRAGKLLNRVLEEAGLERDDFFITNIVKHRPPDNRNPEKEEMDMCFPFFEKQVEAIQPNYIVTLGKVPSQYLLGAKESMRKMRGNIYHTQINKKWFNIVVSVHPAAAIYDWRWEQYLEKDFKMIRELI